LIYVNLLFCAFVYLIFSSSQYSDSEYIEIQVPIVSDYYEPLL